MLNKIKGGLFGFAIGDAMGVTTEFMSQDEIKEEYGVVKEILGGGVFNFERGETSDDTDMTIAVVKGIIENSIYPIEAIGKEFLKWRATNPKDIGITIASTFRNYQDDWFKAAEATHHELSQSGGNGTLMRCLPIALAYSDEKKIDELSALQSKMTHYENSAADACVLYNRITRQVLNGADLKATILTEIKGTIYDIDYSQQPSCLPSGYVVDTLKWVFYWLLNKESFIDVIIGAVNMGGDSDTIAAIAGGLKGIEVGYRHLPNKHIDVLKDCQYLEEIAEIIYEIRDKDTALIKENHAEYIQDLVHLANEIYGLTEQGKHLDNSVELLKQLKDKVFLYRVSLNKDTEDFEKKYKKWWSVRARFRRSNRLFDLGAPTIIILHELDWLKTEIHYLEQIHQGLEPRYTQDELDELESMAQLERDMEEEKKNNGYIENE